MNTKAIETECLILRKFTENDLDAVYKIFSDETVNMFLPWFPLRAPEDAGEFYEKCPAYNYAQKIAYNCAICLSDSPL